MKTKNKIVLITLIAIVLLLAIVIVNILVNSKNDGMENTGIIETKYRVYSKETGWSDWTKNGLTAGDKNSSIADIEIEIDGYDSPIIEVYKNGKWKTSFGKKYNIVGIKFYSMNDFEEDYSLCYRVYNKTDGWLNWSCEYGDISGNINEEITAIEIKSIPNTVLKYEYLKNYVENINSSSIGFDEVE